MFTNFFYVYIIEVQRKGWRWVKEYKKTKKSICEVHTQKGTYRNRKIENQKWFLLQLVYKGDLVLYDINFLVSSQQNNLKNIHHHKLLKKHVKTCGSTKKRRGRSKSASFCLDQAHESEPEQTFCQSCQSNQSRGSP